jgi:protein-tyrosine phosphatase
MEGRAIETEEQDVSADPLSPDLNSRLVPLEGCFNFRDLGGYPTRDGRRVRWGQLFRSDALHFMTEADAHRVRHEIGIRAVVDLRSAYEVEADGLGPLPAEPVVHHHVPLLGNEETREPVDAPWDLGERYFQVLRSASRRIREALSVLARSREPAVFHCAAGKDRTGVVAAVVLGVLGVDEAHIAEDYAFTSRGLGRILARLGQSESYRTIIAELPAEGHRAEARTMATLLGRVRSHYGSMQEYALHAGVEAECIARLELRLLED